MADTIDEDPHVLSTPFRGGARAGVLQQGFLRCPIF
jgi:hypothetical protein